MEITIKNSTQLKIRHRPVGAWISFFFIPIAAGLFLFVVPATEPDERISNFFFSLVFIGFAIIFGSFSRTTQAIIWNFDKSLGTLVVTQRRLLGTKKFQYSLQEIHEVEVDSPWSQELHGIQLLLSEKIVLHLCHDYPLVRDEAERWVEIISTFLKA